MAAPPGQWFPAVSDIGGTPGSSEAVSTPPVPSGEHVVKYTRESSTRTCPGDATLASSTKHRSALQIPIQGALPQIAASTPASSGSGPTGGPLSEHATTRPTNVTKLRRLTDIA